MAHGALTLIIGLRLLALAAGLRHNAEIGQPGLCFSAYGHKFGINHLERRDPAVSPEANPEDVYYPRQSWRLMRSTYGLQ